MSRSITTGDAAKVGVVQYHHRRRREAGCRAVSPPETQRRWVSSSITTGDTVKVDVVQYHHRRRSEGGCRAVSPPETQRRWVSRSITDTGCSNVVVMQQAQLYSNQRGAHVTRHCCSRALATAIFGPVVQWSTIIVPWSLACFIDCLINDVFSCLRRVLYCVYIQYTIK